MKRSLLAAIFFALLTIFCSAFAQTTVLKPYIAGDWKSITKTAAGVPVAIHFWGVTCPSCVKEIPQWGQFLKNNPSAKVVFIQVDDVPMDAMKKMLNKASLESANNYYVAAPFDERLRYEIDPTWHGETPTTIIIDKSGKSIRKTGLMDFQKLQTSLLTKS